MAQGGTSFRDGVCYYTVGDPRLSSPSQERAVSPAFFERICDILGSSRGGFR
jgi:hypothetical protein